MDKNKTRRIDTLTCGNGRPLVGPETVARKNVDYGCGVVNNESLHNRIERTCLTLLQCAHPDSVIEVKVAISTWLIMYGKYWIMQWLLHKIQKLSKCMFNTEVTVVEPRNTFTVTCMVKEPPVPD